MQKKKKKKKKHFKSLQQNMLIRSLKKRSC